MDGSSIKDRLEKIQSKIAIALSKRHSGAAKKVRVVAVSKKQPVSAIREAYTLGLRCFGENYVQEWMEKSEKLADLDLRWHFVGAIQRNKCKQVVGKVDLIHSVDRLELAQTIDNVARQMGVIQDILIQVNLGDESTKNGVSLSRGEELLSRILSLKNVSLKGLMALPPLGQSKEDSRPYFRQLRLLSETWLKDLPTRELSMGTSFDFDVAVEEGATLVRIGTEIFGERG